MKAKLNLQYGQTCIKWPSFNPLSPNGDQLQFSPHHISALQCIEVMKIKQLIKKDELSWCLNNFSRLDLTKMYGDQ